MLPKIFCDCVEAIVGAIYVDSGCSLGVARDVLLPTLVMPLLGPILEVSFSNVTPVTVNSRVC